MTDAMWISIGYFFLSFLWSIFAIRVQKKLYGDKSGLLRYIICWLFNFVFAPVSMMFAIIRCPLEPNEKDKDDEDSIFDDNTEKDSSLFE